MQFIQVVGFLMLKRYFSKTGCVAFNIGGDYLNGSAIRQEYFETAIEWISEGQIESYMADTPTRPKCNCVVVVLSICNYLRQAQNVSRQCSEPQKPTDKPTKNRN
jgi:hypothetical protein